MKTASFYTDIYSPASSLNKVVILFHNQKVWLLQALKTEYLVDGRLFLPEIRQHVYDILPICHLDIWIKEIQVTNYKTGISGYICNA